MMMTHESMERFCSFNVAVLPAFIKLKRADFVVQAEGSRSYLEHRDIYKHQFKRRTRVSLYVSSRNLTITKLVPRVTDARCERLLLLPNSFPMLNPLALDLLRAS